MYSSAFDVEEEAGMLRKREAKADSKTQSKIKKLASLSKGCMMFKVVLTVNGALLKVKYLNSLPVTFEHLWEGVSALLPVGQLSSLMASDPCGDQVTLECDTDIENIYSLAKLTEQKIVKINADFEIKPLAAQNHHQPTQEALQ